MIFHAASINSFSRRVSRPFVSMSNASQRICKVLEYVCIHELAHLREMNHSKRFWSLVHDALPDHRERVAWLKAHGHECRF